MVNWSEIIEDVERGNKRIVGGVRYGKRRCAMKYENRAGRETIVYEVGDQITYTNGRGEEVDGVVTRVYPDGRVDAIPRSKLGTLDMYPNNPAKADKDIEE